MDSLIHADVFFFITTVVVVIVGFILSVALVYAVRIFKDVSEISKKVRQETEKVTHDISSLRQAIREEGAKLSHITDFFSSFMKSKKSRRSKKIISDNQ